jgi:hypothetical protein
MNEQDLAVGWRCFQRNWIAIGLMVALSLALTRFSIELSGLALSLGFAAVYAGFAYANAYSKGRRDPQVIFVLGSTAQIVLVTVVMSAAHLFGGGREFSIARCRAARA